MAQISQAKSGSRVYHVIDYGADPTGVADSFAAISKAISDAFADAASGLSLIAGISNLGGIEVHLDGGVYVVTSPLTLPANGGNVKVRFNYVEDEKYY